MFDELTYEVPDWDGGPALESEVYREMVTYDALDRALSHVTGRVGGPESMWQRC